MQFQGGNGRHGGYDNDYSYPTGSTYPAPLSYATVPVYPAPAAYPIYPAPMFPSSYSNTRTIAPTTGPRWHGDMHPGAANADREMQSRSSYDPRLPSTTSGVSSHPMNTLNPHPPVSSNMFLNANRPADSAVSNAAGSSSTSISHHSSTIDNNHLNIRET
jgi:hypothetical protein